MDADGIAMMADFAEEHGHDGVAKVLRAWADNPELKPSMLANYIRFSGEIERRFAETGRDRRPLTSNHPSFATNGNR